MKKGDLLYAPSHVRLYKFNQEGQVQNYYVLKEPVNLLLLEKDIRDYVKVWFAGEEWYISHDDTRLIMEGM